MTDREFAGSLPRGASTVGRQGQTSLRRRGTPLVDGQVGYPPQPPVLHVLGWGVLGELLAQFLLERGLGARGDDVSDHCTYSAPRGVLGSLAHGWAVGASRRTRQQPHLDQ
jgi:hypothetical protein